jgi:hypothetical protein
MTCPARAAQLLAQLLFVKGVKGPSAITGSDAAAASLHAPSAHALMEALSNYSSVVTPTSAMRYRGRPSTKTSSCARVELSVLP